MVEKNSADSTGPEKPSGSADLDQRLRQLEERIGKASDTPQARSETDAFDEGDGPSGLAAGLRISTEFVAGIIAGVILGWAFDKFVGTSPWGLIVFLLLGFAAGIRNIVRVSGTLGRKAGK